MFVAYMNETLYLLPTYITNKYFTKASKISVLPWPSIGSLDRVASREDIKRMNESFNGKLIIPLNPYYDVSPNVLENSPELQSVIYNGDLMPYRFLVMEPECFYLHAFHDFRKSSLEDGYHSTQVEYISIAKGGKSTFVASDNEYLEFNVSIIHHLFRKGKITFEEAERRMIEQLKIMDVFKENHFLIIRDIKDKNGLCSKLLKCLIELNIDFIKDFNVSDKTKKLVAEIKDYFEPAYLGIVEY